MWQPQEVSIIRDEDLKHKVNSVLYSVLSLLTYILSACFPLNYPSPKKKWPKNAES